MVFQGAIDSVTRARVYYLCKIQGLSVRIVAQMCQISRTSVSRITKEGADGNRESSKQHAKREPKMKLSARQKRQILRAIVRLRERVGHFSCKGIMQEAGVSVTEVSVRTVCRFLNSEGYYFLQSRKKGILTVADMCKRLKFARQMKREYHAEVWTTQVAFYLDAVSFTYKRNPLEQARAPKSRIWRKRGEGLTTGCLAKGRKEGTGGKYVSLIVAISYGKGVIACHPYQKMTGRFFANFIEANFPRMFQVADKGEENVFVQDNCPCQNSALAEAAMEKCRCSVLNLPPKSADVHCIKNLFPIISRKLQKQATDNQISKESHSEFEARVINTFYSVPVTTINNLIASMPKRICQVIARKGSRIKY